ncbi:MAG: DUF4097 family beta strand repeat-containing protein [Sedimentisphaerales bacterium]|nr:DUF4097 family beta strand repeat-containing protein [Sedimentisphaerales bacterium]
MNHDFLKPVLLILLLCLLTLGVGSCINIARAKYERTVQLSAPLSPGSNFTAETHNGSITISGADVADCNLTATIVGRATTEEGAKKIAEQTTIKLIPSANKLTARIDKPKLRFNKSVSVSIDVTIPDNTDLELTTHNGALVIKNITGRLNGTTHNGKIAAEQVSGAAELYTHNGSVTCREISGDTKLKTHNGGIKVYYSQAAPSVCDISLITHNGGVELETPKNFSGELEASTHNGSINTELPVTVKGKVSKRKLTGTIGTGQGKLYLETHNGSIRIK